MSNRNYPWKRFWCPRDQDFALDDRGYLLDPERWPGYAARPLAYEQIAHHTCLVLLGEPGIGKSKALEAERNSIRAEVAKRGEDLLWRDLKTFSSDSLLVKEVFESQQFLAWAKGTHVLHLFLDSLDECRLQVPAVGHLLVDKLEEFQGEIERLRLRVACRTAALPDSLASGLERLWPKEQVGTYKLSPLRRRDVEAAAEISVLVPAEFLAAVEDKGVEALASKPVTLEFLLNIWNEDGQLPARQAELYTRGCELLATEQRELAPSAPRPEPKHRVALAARIAAGLIFCNRIGLFRGVDRGDVSRDELKLEELSGGEESVGLQTLPVSLDSLERALDTGLFTSRGPNRFGFAHQTYAEFLAAKYLMDRGLETKQILSLIRHPEDSTGAVVPQLAETAAWLAGMSEEVFREILNADPQVLLRSDVAQASAEDRAKLVESLLARFAREELLDSDFKSRDGYRRLAHPGLAEQLTPYLKRPGSAWLVRRVAIQIAAACKLNALEGALLKIALDVGEFYPTRVEAARAVAEMGSEQAKALLLPLALGEAGEDPDDELKGYALRALWPALMTPEDFFRSLTPPKRDLFLGAYRGLLELGEPFELQPPDLPCGLSWVAQLGRGTAPEYSPQRLVDRLMAQGLRECHRPEVQEPLVEALLARSLATAAMASRFEIASEVRSLLEEPTRRRLLCTLLVKKHGSEPRNHWLLARTGCSVAQAEDLPWVIEQLDAEDQAELAEGWARLARGLFHIDQPGHAELILQAVERSDALRQEFSRLLGSVALDSEEASEARACHVELVAAQQPNETALLVPAPAERVRKLLDQFDAGDLDAWWVLVRELILEPTSTHYGDEFNPLLDELPGWLEASEETRDRILRAAEAYLLKRDAAPDGWLGKDMFHRPATAGYKAICLLARQAPRVLESLTSVVWERWTPIVLGYTFATSTDASGELHLGLVAFAYRECPGIFLEVLDTLLGVRNQKGDCHFILDRLSHCWDSRVTEILLRAAKREDLRPSCLRQLLAELINRGSLEAEAFARWCLRQPLPSGARERERAVAAGCALMGAAPDAGWSAIWPVLQVDETLGQDLTDQAVGSFALERKLLAKLDEVAVANLFLWLSARFPQRQVPDGNGLGPGRHLEAVGIFLDHLLGTLRHRATPAACRELARLVEELPELPHLKFILLEAKQETRRKSWSPPSPEVLLAVTRKRGARWVRNGDDLLDAVLESLARLQGKLQGKPPAVPDLWNANRPKDEAHFSDYVKRHLDNDLEKAGIIALREVQIQRGEKTDLHVTGLVPGLEPQSWEMVACIIEVKGSWHEDVRTAMKSQLVDRYLANNTCQHGLYLVGWFLSSAWDPKDSRLKKHLKWTLAEAARELHGQAVDLSSRGLKIRSLLLDSTPHDQPPRAPKSSSGRRPPRC